VLPAGFQVVGEWAEPPTIRSQRPGTHGVHAGEVRFVRKVRASDAVRPGEYGATCSIRYQACNARQCLAPVTFALSATVAVESGASDTRRRLP
jgi:hypothetical protein